MAQKTPPSRVVAGVSIPDTPLVESAIKFAQSHLSPMSFNHVMRSLLFGFAIGSKTPAFSSRDLEVHAVSAILHDMGWDATGKLISDDKRFEVDGANAARDFLTRNAPDWDKYRVQLVWDSIALHTTMSIVFHHSMEAIACTSGIKADFTGPTEDPNDLSKNEYDAIVKEYPRLNMADGVKEIFCGFCKTKPETTQDNIVGQIGQAYVDGFHVENDWFVKMLAETKRTLDS